MGRAEAVVIGSSAGAIEALSQILPALPADYPLPVMIVIHLPPDRKSIAAELFQAKSKVRVKEVEDTEVIEPATVYLAAPDYHMLVEPSRRLSLSSDVPVHFSRPSIDVLFETAADAYGEGLVGIVLTGANSDGSDGALAIEKAGGTVIVQDPSTAYASAMPRAALEKCPDAIVLSIDNIIVHLQTLASQETP